MVDTRKEPLWSLLGVLFKAHPWHGVPIGKDPPALVTAYIEIVPSDTIKYELDKYTGHLKVDRPQAYSNICPTLYGFVPQTFCGEQVAALCCERTGRSGVRGDEDPLDICVLSEKVISHGDILLEAVPIGGLRMLDGAEADDKIVAVMKGDAAFGAWRDITDAPPAVVERLKHYFLTYKRRSDAAESPCEITHVYGRDEAHDVIRRAHADYMTRFADIEGVLTAALRG